MSLKATVILFCLSLSFAFSQSDDKLLRSSLKREDSSQIKIKRLRLNSEYSDFSPFILKDRLLFVSSRYNESGVVYTDQSNNETTDIFEVKKNDSLSFSSVSSIGGNLNSKLNEGPFCLNKSGDIIYYTANDAAHHLKIFRSQKINGQWSKPEEMSFCPAGFSSCHPTLSSDGKTIVFSSNVNGGFGGMDLYMTQFENNSWTKPKNLGNKINSQGNEVFPFLDRKNNLYFSANREEGFGGLDIYCANINTINGIRHLDYPLNSGSDDFGICVDSSGNTGYFSSDRIKKTKDDIFYFYHWIPDGSEFKTFVSKNKFCYTFYEESVIDGKDTMNLTYEWNFGDGKKERGEKIKHCYDKPGNYNIELNIVQKVSGEIFQSQAAYSLTVEEPERLTIVSKDTIVTGNELTLSQVSALKKYSINKTYWSFGDGKFNDGIAVKHKYKKKGYYTVELLVEAQNKDTGKIEKLKVNKKITVKDEPIYASQSK